MNEKIMIIYGTRPEIIKLAPIILKLKEKIKNGCIVVNTGQHKDMTKDFEKIFSIHPDYNLDIMEQGQTLNTIIVNAIREIDKVLSKETPDVVLVQGDTTTVLAGGIACYYKNIAVGHVEAGLRSFNLQEPYPEEFNRKVISIFAKYNFVPTETSKNNLLKEGIPEERIFVTGNTVVDALQIIMEKSKRNEIKVGISIPREKNILITAHRRENFGQGIVNICKAVKRLAEQNKDYDMYWPVHPNPNVKQPVFEQLSNISNIHLLEPLNYIDLVYLMSKSYLILTDSGGIQEESPSLKKPVLILRNLTERPEVVDSGFGILVGTDVEKIVLLADTLINDRNLYNKTVSGYNPFGNGKAAAKIIDIL